MEPVPLTHGGVDRRYLLARPAGGGRPPLAVFLPGTGGTAAWADGEAGWSAFFTARGFAVAVPEGLPPDPGKPPRFLTNPPRWNDGSARPGDLLTSAADDVGFLAAVASDAADRCGADPRRVGVSGFSNGAGMAFRLAAERADLVAAVAPVAGHCWVDPRPARPVPTLYLIGTADPLIPVRGGPVRLPWGGRLTDRPAVAVTLERWAAAVGCSPMPVVRAEADGVREDEYPGPVEVRAVTIDGLGHHWPGGKGQLNPRIGGPPSGRVSANERIAAFFRRHL